MVRSRRSAIIRRIKQCTQDGLVLFTDHARREMNDDDLDEEDVSTAILKGIPTARLTRGGRGTRHVLRGPARDGRPIEVVCRTSGDWIRIVTTYRL